MDTANRLFVWMAYTIGACGVGGLAVFALRYYGTVDRSPSRTVSPPQVQTSSPFVSAEQKRSLRSGHIDYLYAQRSEIKRLRSLLEQKTELLEKKAALLRQKTAEQAALKKELDQLTGLLELMAANWAETDQPAHGEPAANEELRKNLERLIAHRQQSDSQAERQQEEVDLLKAELAATEQEIAVLRQETALESDVLRAEKAAFEQIAGEVLTRIGPEAVPVLTEQLSSERLDVRRWAATVLGSMGPDAIDAIPALMAASSDDDPAVRKAVREALDRISPSR